MYGGVPPPPPSEQPAPIPAGCPSVAPYLAPPPGFSDSEHSLSDCDSMGSENSGGGNFQRFGFSRVSKPRSLAVPSLTEQLRKERMVTQVSQVSTSCRHVVLLSIQPSHVVMLSCFQANQVTRFTQVSLVSLPCRHISVSISVSVSVCIILTLWYHRASKQCLRASPWVGYWRRRQYLRVIFLGFCWQFWSLKMIFLLAMLSVGDNARMSTLYIGGNRGYYEQ